MKKNIFKALTLVVALSVSLASCNNWKNLAKDYYTVSPNPLEYKGGKVDVNIKGQFPAKTFKPTVALEIVPELVYANGKTALDPVTYQGEKFPGNNTVIPAATGKSVTYASSVDYKPEMEKSELIANLTAIKGGKRFELGSIKIADGVITTPLLVKDSYKYATAPSNFVRDTRTSQSAQVHFLVNSSAVRSSELRNKSYLAAVSFLKQAANNPVQRIDGIDFVGFASPEGEATLNENLSIDRAKAIEKYLQQEVKKAKISISDETAFYSEKGEGADWNGFFELLANSSMQDKDMIKRSLDGEPLLATKEKTLKSLESTYNELRDKLLPELRRCEIKINYTILGKTDEVILSLARTNPSQLTNNELLHAAELLDDAQDKIAVYKAAQAQFPSDYRAFNNEGVIQHGQGNAAVAKSLFEKAYGIEKNAVTNNNYGALQAATDTKAALETFKSSSVAEASYNQGIIHIKNGSYGDAVKAFSGVNDFNSALAKVLNSDYKGAVSTLDSANDNTALANYLRGIAYARQGQNAEAKKMIGEVASSDAVLAAKAQKDLEFRAIYATTTEETAK